MVAQWAKQLGVDFSLPGSVELVVRSHARELPMLLLFLRSVELYWPWPHVLVVLDDAEADRSMAAALPSWCRVLYEAPPPHFEDYPAVRYGRDKPRSQGYVRAQWSMFQLDRYTDCDYIAFCDCDVVFFTFVTPHILFSPSGKPYLKGHRGMPMFHRAIAVLGWQFVAEFMQGFPLLLHRSTFALARAQVARAAAGPATRCWRLGLCRHWGTLLLPEGAKHLGSRDSWDFDLAFLWLSSKLWEYGRRIPEDATTLPCAQSILGHLAWHHQRSLYTWSIMDEGLLDRYMGDHAEFENLLPGPTGALRAFPAEHTCPSLSAAIHLGHYNSEAVRRASAEYFEVGRGMLLTGICEPEHDYELVRRETVCAQSVAGPRYFEELPLLTLDQPLGALGAEAAASRCAAECWARPFCTNFVLSRNPPTTCIVVGEGCAMRSNEPGWDYYALHPREGLPSDVGASGVDGNPGECWASLCGGNAVPASSWGCRPGGSLNFLTTSLSWEHAIGWAGVDALPAPGNCTSAAALLTLYRSARLRILRSLGRSGRGLLATLALGAPRGPPPRPVSSPEAFAAAAEATAEQENLVV